MSTSATPAAAPPRAAFPSLQWWIRDRDGKVVLAQAPNPPLLVWLACVVVGWTGVLDDDKASTIGHVGQGALAAWALDEVVRGASPVRRVLGAVVLTGLAVRLLS